LGGKCVLLETIGNACTEQVANIDR